MKKNINDVRNGLITAKPALEALVEATPWGLGNLALGTELGRDPSLLISLPVPGSQPVEIRAHVRFGTEWTIEVSGASWKVGSEQDLRYHAGVLHVAAAILSILKAA